MEHGEKVKKTSGASRHGDVSEAEEEKIKELAEVEEEFAFLHPQ